jgi:Fe-S-cluster containining protein
MAYSARLGRAAPLENELIKLRERSNGGCVFLKDSLCQIYENRPLQCRWLRCWDGTHAGQLEDRPRLTRQDIFAGEQRSLDLIREYEIKMPGDQLARAFQAAAEGFQQIALDMIEMDLRLRAGVQASFGYHFDSLDLLWGRSALEVAKSHGLALGSSKDGSPVLARQ